MKRRSRLMWSSVLIVTILIAIGALLTSGEANAMNPHFFGQPPTRWQPAQWGFQAPTNVSTDTSATPSQVSATPSDASAPPPQVSPTPSDTPTASTTGNQSLPSASNVSSSTQRTVTLTNTTQQTVWAVSTGNPGYTPPAGGEWVLAPGQTTTVTYPSTWNGRIWGRTGCSFDGAGQGSCETGDCGAGITCPNVADDLPSVTLAEFNMQGTGIDYYDVSQVDGFNLPVTINVVSGQMGVPANVSCVTAACATNMDSASVCPAVLQVKDAGGNVIACNSACNVLHQDQYCCANAYANAATCNPNTWPVNYAAIFKQAVPYAYSYPFDDATSVFTCVNNCNYQIVFGG